MSEHTPGPWTIEYFAAKDTEPDEGAMTGIMCYADENGCEGAILATMNRWTYGDDPPTPESDANAHLIAAAPDLLAACKAMRACQHHGFNAHYIPAAIRTLADAAIAKAEGAT